MLGESATPESVAALSAKLGLDRPALVRYGDWMKGLATGELGTSIAYDTPIAQLVGERLVVTVPLALMAMALTTALAFSLGLFAAARHGRAGDVGVMAASQIGIAMPELLVRDPADLAVRGEAALVLGRRLSRLERRRRRRRRPGAARAGPAGGRARRRAGGDPGAHRPLGGARRAARGLRPHRARQGPVAARRALGPRAAATRWCRC